MGCCSKGFPDDLSKLKSFGFMIGESLVFLFFVFCFFVWNPQAPDSGSDPEQNLVLTCGCDMSLVFEPGSDPRTKLDDPFHITAFTPLPRIEPGSRRCEASVIATELSLMKTSIEVVVQRRRQDTEAENFKTTYKEKISWSK